MSGADIDIPATITRAVDGHRRSIARLISCCEDTRARGQHARDVILSILARSSSRRTGLTVGITGPPGAGKSTLIGMLAPAMIGRAEARGDDHRVAIVAIDPTSPISGGALLGDRARVRFPLDNPRLFFRSQASAMALGGVAPSTWPVVRLLTHLFDTVLIETVGVGQSEIDARALADHLVLVSAPLAGDSVQYMKAGLTEVPDRIVLNKCDQRDAARDAWTTLRAHVRLLRPGSDAPDLHRVSALSGDGVDDLAAALLACPRDSTTLAGAALKRRHMWLERRARARYGTWGIERLANVDLGAWLTEGEDESVWQRVIDLLEPGRTTDVTIPRHRGA